MFTEEYLNNTVPTISATVREYMYKTKELDCDAFIL